MKKVTVYELIERVAERNLITPTGLVEKKEGDSDFLMSVVFTVLHNSWWTMPEIMKYFHVDYEDVEKRIKHMQRLSDVQEKEERRMGIQDWVVRRPAKTKPVISDLNKVLDWVREHPGCHSGLPLTDRKDWASVKSRVVICYLLTRCMGYSPRELTSFVPVSERMIRKYAEGVESGKSKEARRIAYDIIRNNNLEPNKHPEHETVRP